MDPASSIPIGSLLLYVLFLLLSAYFASAETAYTAVSKVRMRTLADKGDKRAKRVLWISDRFDKTLTTILIGNNVFHASCASLSALLVLSKFGEEDVIYGTLLTTFVVYLFAEMILHLLFLFVDRFLETSGSIMVRRFSGFLGYK